MNRLFTFIFICCTFSLLAQNSSAYTDNLKLAHRAIVELRFKEAEDRIASERKQNPENLTSEYLQGALMAVRLFINEDERRLEQTLPGLEHIVNRLEGLPDDDPQRNLYVGELLLAQAILNGKYQNRFTAAWQFYRAYQLLKVNQQQHPDFIPNKIPLGVLLAAIGSLPDDYRSLASMLGIDGDVRQGLAMLADGHEAIKDSEEWQFLSPYSGFVYAFVHHQLSAETGEVSPLTLDLPIRSSSFLIYLQAKIDRESGHGQRALRFLQNRPTGSSYAAFPYMHYLTGKSALGIDNQLAEDELLRFLQVAPNGTYQKSTYRYLSWLALLEGDVDKAESYRQKVLTRGDDHSGADRQALHEARYAMNACLIEARILFDAGMMAKALEALESAKNCHRNEREMQEYHYRKGRVLQELTKASQALHHFREALKLNENSENYAAANSALQAGYILLERGDNPAAKRMFQKALEYNDFPFYEGIHQRAKAALARL